MKIIKLQSENYKRLVAVEITPEGNVVEITGKNGQGKTSVLDAIWVALGGLDAAAKLPIHKGALEAKIALTLGDAESSIVVTRTFRPGKNDAEITSRLTVESADGAKYSSPQAMLDKLLGALTFDPLAFDRMDARAQFNTLRRFVPDVDFDALDQASKADYDRRTALNRQAKELDAQARAIRVDPDGPTEAVDIAALVAELEAAGKHNTDIETRKANRARMQGEANLKKEAAVQHRNRSAQLREEADKLDQAATELLSQAASIEQRIDAAGPLAASIDTTIIRSKIATAESVNQVVAARQRRNELIAKRDEIEHKANELSLAIDGREVAKREAIAKANLPVTGIGFGDNQVLLNDVPWAQGSDAERLIASISMAMAMNPKLRIIRVRDGSLLDDDSMALLADLAQKHDYQVWIERVDSSGKVGVVIENGRVKRQEPHDDRPSRAR